MLFNNYTVTIQALECKDRYGRTDVANSDLSDHHPCKWTCTFRNGYQITGITYNVQFMPITRLGLGNITFIPVAPVEKDRTHKIKIYAQVIALWLLDENADVICLQELFDKDASTEIKRILDTEYFITKRVGGFITRVSGGVRTFVKKNSAFRYLRHLDYPGLVFKNKIGGILGTADAVVDKGIKHVSITTAAVETIHMFNIHVQAYYEVKDNPERKLYIEITFAQFVEIYQYIVEMKKKGIILSGQKILIVGDFNISSFADDNFKDYGFHSNYSHLNTENVIFSADQTRRHFDRLKALFGNIGFIPQHLGLGTTCDPENNSFLRGKVEPKKNLDMIWEIDADEINEFAGNGFIGPITPLQFLQNKQLELANEIINSSDSKLQAQYIAYKRKSEEIERLANLYK